MPGIVSGGGTFSIARESIPYLNQTVYIDGARNDQLWCVAIHPQAGGATTAEFDIPQKLFDSARDDLKDAFVSVYLLNAYDGSSSATPDFLGYLDTDNAECTEGSDMVRLSAITITGYLSKIYVGQQKGRIPEVRYKKRDTVANRYWKPYEALRDMFGSGGNTSPSGGMPSQYRARIEIGVVTPLYASNGTRQDPELVFRNCTYEAAIDQILALYGDVSYRERFQGVKVYLDFFRVQDSTNPITQVRVCNWDDPITGNSNVARIRHNQSVRDTVNRVIFTGAPRRFMVSCKSAVPGATGTLASLGESTAAKALQRNWATSLEALVKANPKIAKQGALNVLVTVTAASGATSLSVKTGVAITTGAILFAKNGEQLLVTGYTPGTAPEGTVIVTRGYNSTTADEIPANDTLQWRIPGAESVFREYLLPDCFRDLVKPDSNIKRRLKDENGATLSAEESDRQKYKLQVWKYPTVRNNAGDGSFAGELQTTPVQIKNFRADLKNNRIILAEPALNEMAGAKSENTSGLNITYAEAVVGVTFTYESPDYLYHDTGEVNGGDLSLDFKGDGLTETVPRDDLAFEQLTNANYPIRVSSSTTLTFDCLYFDEDLANGPATTKLASSYSASTYLVKDDTNTIRTLANEVLREKNRRHHSYDIEIPYYTRAYRIGNLVIIRGQANYVAGTYMITGVDHFIDSRFDQYTTLTVDNVKPPYRSEVNL